jgi:SAM-dependent methyltransferase
VAQFYRFQKLSRASQRQLPVRWKDQHPFLSDATNTTPFDRHYVYHTAWAARVLATTKPAVHVDISSSLYFVTNLSAFIPVEFFDYRPADITLPGLTSGRADLCNLPFSDASVYSLSCMHVVEHIGLGRYGDPLDPQGDLKAMAELQRVLAVDGSLLFVVPVGAPRTCFNAHRIYAYDQIIAAFAELTLVTFALIRDDAEGGGLLIDAPPAMVASQRYGCGCFWFKRPGN